MKIRIKIVCSFALIIIIVSSGLLFSLYQTREVMIDSTSANTITFARNILDRLDQRTQNSITELRIIALNPEVKDLVAQSNREFDKIDDVDSYRDEKGAEWRSYAGKENPIFNEMVKNPLSQRLEELRQTFHKSSGVDIFPEIFVANKYGVTIAANNKLTDWDQSERLQFHNTRDYGWHVSDLYYDKSASVWGLEVAVAVTDGDGFAGMVKTVFAIEAVKEILLELKKESQYNDFRVFLFTGDDRYIYSDDPNVGELGDDATATFIGYEQHSTEEGRYIVPVFGINRLTAWSTSDGFRDFPGLGWKLVLSIPEQEFLDPIDEIQNILIGIIVTSIAAVIVISILMVKGIVPPIKKLEKSAQQISQENFDVKVVVKSKDELGSLAKSINEMAQKLKNAKKEKQEFLAMITHELKTPLTPIQGFCELLKDPDMGELNEDQKEAVDEIYKNSEELLHLIGNVLTAQKIEINQLKFNIQEIGVDEFMKGRYRSLLPLMAEKGIKFVNSTEKGLVANGDNKKLNEVFANLVENSIDFVPDKNGRIEIGAKSHDKKVLFYVKDNGKGIPKDKIKNMFKKFYQIDSSYTRKHGGSGLGLSICKGYIEGLGGKMWVESEPNVETTFYFTLARVWQKASFEEYEKSYVSRHHAKKGKKITELKEERN